jgi:hypothetical protein
VYTYSQGQRPDLDENHLNENNGVGDHVARDWNGNGTMQPDVSVDLTGDGLKTTIRDNADWANIEINFRAAGTQWNSN